MLKIVPSVATAVPKFLKRSVRKPVPGAKNYFDAYPDFVEKFKAMTVGGTPLFLPDGRLNPCLYIGGKEYDGDKKLSRRRRRPSRSVRRVA